MKIAKDICFVLFCAVNACIDIEGPVPEAIDPGDAFAHFSFTSNALYIKQSTTLPLSLNAYATDGSPITMNPQRIRWYSQDSVRIYVDSLGRVTADSIIPHPVTVTAEYSHSTTTRRAEILVFVTANQTPAQTLKMIALDSTRVGGGGPEASLPRIRLDLYDGDNLILAGADLPVDVPKPYVARYVRDGGPNKEPVYTIANGGSGVNKFWVTSSVNLYGTEVRDSLEFTGLYPFKVAEVVFSETVTGDIVADNVGVDLDYRQQPCAIVRMWNLTSKPLDLLFSDSAATAMECDPLPDSVLKYYSIAGVPFSASVGNNLLAVPPFSISIRRSKTIGQISWRLRDPDTNELSPFTGTFHSIHVD